MGNEILDKAVKQADLNIHQLANAVADVVIDDYGSHNADAFKDIINERLGVRYVIESMTEFEWNDRLVQLFVRVYASNFNGETESLGLTSEKFMGKNSSDKLLLFKSIIINLIEEKNEK